MMKIIIITETMKMMMTTQPTHITTPTAVYAILHELFHCLSSFWKVRGRDLTSSGRLTHMLQRWTQVLARSPWLGNLRSDWPWSATHPASHCHCKIAYGSFCTWRQLALLFIVDIRARCCLHSQKKKKKSKDRIRGIPKTF